MILGLAIYLPSNLVNIYLSKLLTERLEKGVKYVQS